MIHLQRKPHALSAIPGHEGPCIATWLNRSRLMGSREGTTGFFRLCRRLAPGIYWTYGQEFHGGVPYSAPFTVVSTESWR